VRFILRVSAFVVTPLLTLALLVLPLAAQEHKQDRPQAKPMPSATSNAQGNTAGAHANSGAKPSVRPNQGIIDIDIYAPKPKAPGAGNQVTGNTVSNANVGNTGRQGQLNAARPPANRNAKGIIDVDTNSPKPRTSGVGVGTGNQVTGNTVSNANVGNTGRQAQLNAARPPANSSAKPNAQSNKGIIDIDFNAPKPKAPGAGNQVTGNAVSNANIGNTGRQAQLNAARPPANSSAKPNAQPNKGIIDIDFNAPKPKAPGAGNQVTGNTVSNANVGTNAPKARTPGVGVGTSNQVTGNAVSNANIGTNAPKPRTPGVGMGAGNQVTGNTVSNASVGDSGRQTRSIARGSNQTNAQVKGTAAGTQTKGNAKPITGDAGKQAAGTAAHTQPKSTTAAPK
jgi:hypothetical protein